MRVQGVDASMLHGGKVSDVHVFRLNHVYANRSLAVRLSLNQSLVRKNRQ